MVRDAAFLARTEVFEGGKRKALAFGCLLVAFIFAGLLLSPKPAYAANFDVDSTADTDTGACTAAASDCTLRGAINAANAATGADTINFDIPETDTGRDATTGVFTISPASALPTITDQVTIDGYTQRGARANTLEQGNDAVLLIELNGTNAGSSAAGLKIAFNGSNSVIRGLIINRFGPSSESGVCPCGLDIRGDGNHVEGNFIGTDASGTLDQGNTSHGVWISTGAYTNIVGGNEPGMRNVISGNDGDGVRIQGDAKGNQVRGNYIGTDKNGTQKLGNGNHGVDILFGSDNLVGGPEPGARNVISGNDFWGVTIRFDASANKVEGNFIGTDASGTNNVGNGASGVNVEGATNTVGGTEAGTGNTIAFNGGGPTGDFSNSGNDGVRVVGEVTGNTILSNSIFSNDGLGIDLASDGVTPNDDDDSDTGPNNLQNFPVLDSATETEVGTATGAGTLNSTPGTTTVTGTLNSTPDTTFTVQFFASPEKDPSGYGEGKKYLGQQSVSTDSSGKATVSFATDEATAGEFVSATATDSNSNTSEFSNAVVVVNTPPEAAPQSVSIDQDQAKTIILSATDADGDDLTFEVIDQPDHGALGSVGAVTCDGAGSCSANVTYTPNKDYNGDDSFTYTVSDPQGATDTATVSVRVLPQTEAAEITCATRSDHNDSRVICEGTNNRDQIRERKGASKDDIRAKDGNDTINARRAGRDDDTVRAQPGDDKVFANDRDTRDKIDCGQGTDEAKIDVKSDTSGNITASDQVSSDCETVRDQDGNPVLLTALPETAVVDMADNPA